MEVSKSQDLTRLGARVKLLSRQLHEWNRLLQNQKQVRDFLYELTSQASVNNINQQVATLTQGSRYCSRLNALSERQRQERQAMRIQHRQEELDLEGVLGITN